MDLNKSGYKKKVLVDMDDVMTVGGLEQIVSDFIGTYVDPNSFKSYYLQDLVPEERRLEFMIELAKGNWYAAATITEGCAEVLEKLNEKYDVYITSAFILREVAAQSGKHLFNKFNFLTNNFPFLDTDKFIFTGSKAMIKADIRIDDLVRHLDVGDDSQKILFTAYHNTNITKEELGSLNIQRANNWKEIGAILL